MLNVVEIFKSIDGEGIRAGLPTTFIRLAGCNLRCAWCDTTYSYGSECESTPMSTWRIITCVDEFLCPSITITGGEPLLNDEVYELIEELLRRHYQVNIETNGSVSLDRLDALRNKLASILDDNQLLVTMDWKCPSSGMTNKMNTENSSYLKNYDVLKFVVADETDLDEMGRYLTEVGPSCHVFVSPVFGKIEPEKIVDYILDNDLYEVRVQLQLHKIIWDKDKRGV